MGKNYKSWDEQYESLKEYKEEKGCLPSFRTVYRECKIGMWVKAQKQNYKKGVLSPEREALLRSVGLDFDRTKDMALEEDWQGWFGSLAKYKEDNGKLPTLTAGVDKYNLAAWLQRQKDIYRQGKLSPEHEAQLRSIGVEFERTKEVADEERWQKMFGLMVEHKDETGRLPSLSTVYKEQNLGNWLHTQRTAYKEGKLSPEREAKLREIGVEFGSRAEKKD